MNSMPDVGTVSWEGGQRLAVWQRGQVLIYPPPGDLVVSRGDFAEGCHLVIGEAAGRLGRWSDWLTDGGGWTVFDGRAPRPEYRELAKLIEAATAPVLVRAVERLPDGLELGEEWLLAELASVRRLFEGQARAHPLVYVSADDAPFDPPANLRNSNLVEVSSCWRLPHFTADELEVAWANGSGTFQWGEHGARAARACVEWTGGQPLLADLYTRRLADLVGDGAPTPDLARAAGLWLVDHPPAALSTWRRQLARCLARQPHSLPSLARDCQRGARLPTAALGPDTRCLYLSGWLGHHRWVPGEGELRWGFSACHQRWARDVLLDPRRFGGAP